MRYLSTEDARLRGKGEEFRESLDHLDDSDWDEAVIRFFRGLGFCVLV